MLMPVPFRLFTTAIAKAKAKVKVRVKVKAKVEAKANANIAGSELGMWAAGGSFEKIARPPKISAQLCWPNSSFVTF